MYISELFIEEMYKGGRGGQGSCGDKRVKLNKKDKGGRPQLNIKKKQKAE